VLKKDVLVGKYPELRIGNMLAEIDKILAESSNYSTLSPPRQQPLVKLLLPATLTDPNQTFFSFESEIHPKVNPVFGIRIYCAGER